MTEQETLEVEVLDAPPPQKSSRWKKILAVCLLLPIILVGSTIALIQTERGTSWVCQVVNRLSGGSINVDWRTGSLAHGGAASSVAIHLSKVNVDITNISGTWSWRYLPLKWQVENLVADEVNVTLIPHPDTGKPVGDILMPFEIAANRVQVATVNIISGTSTTSMTQVDGAVSTDKRNHVINLANLTQGAARYEGSLRIDGARPYPLESKIKAVSEFESNQYTLDLTATGDLKHLNLGLNASGGVDSQPLNGKGDIELQLLEQYYIHKGQLDISHINPYVFWSKLPKADLDITLNATPQAVEQTNERNPVNGQWQMVNHAPAPLSDFSLPLTQVTGRFALTSDVQTISDIDIKVSNNGHITGSGVSQKGKGQFKFDVQGFDLKNVHPKMLATQLAGKLNMDVDKTEQHFVADLKNAGANRLDMFADVMVNRTKVIVTQARISTVGEAKIEAQGELAYTQGLPFKGKAQLVQFNLADLGAFPNSRLVGQFDVDGMSIPNAKVNIKGNLNNSLWAGVAARGDVDVSFEAPDKIVSRVLDITIGANHIDAKGALGISKLSQDKLNVNINAPNLAQLQFGLAGSLIGKAELTGSLTQPRGQVDLTANDLKFGEQSVQSAKINGVWDTGSQGTMKGTVDVSSYTNGRIKMDTLKLDVNGTQAAHQFNAHMAGNVLVRAGLPAKDTKAGKVAGIPPVQWILNGDINGNGRLDDHGWQGQITKLNNQGQPNISIEQPFQAAWEKGELKLGRIVAKVQDAQINIEKLNVLGARIDSKGRVDNLVIPQWLTWLNVTLPNNLTTDMTIKGQWDLVMGQTPSGGFSFERERGDLMMEKRALGLSEFDFKGVINGRNMNITGLMQSDRLGQINVTGKMGLVGSDVGWVVSSLSPLDLTAKAQFDKLDQFNSLLGANIKLQGQMQANINIGGILSEPIMTGELTGQNIDFLHIEQGVRFKDGVIKLKLADSSVDFEQFDFNGVEGKLSVRGQVTYGSSGKLLTAKISMDKLRPFVRLDRQLVLSGQAELGYDGVNQLLIKGKVKADKALIDLPPTLAPSLGDDVVVCSSDSKKSRRCDNQTGQIKAERLGLIPSVDLTLELGDDFRFKGQGADVKLVGSIHLESNEGSPLRAKGVVRVDNGTYKFYGQRLNVERGIVTFQGPMDDPALNMYATRTVNTVEVGVELTGTLADSKARLISTPEMPDEEILSYLLFGRSSSTLSTTDGSAIAGAAAILLGTDQGRKVTERLGIDSFNLGSSDNGLTGTVVGVGKRLNDRFSVAYEQSLSDVVGVVKVTWTLSRNWQMILRGGSINGVDVQYSKRFDKIR